MADLVGIETCQVLKLPQSGLPVVGSFSAPGVYDEGAQRSEVETVESALSRAPQRWEELPRPMEAEAHKEELWSGAMEEVEKGWLRPPVKISEDLKSSCVPVRRFGVAQGGMLRACDNCRRSGTNDASVVETPITPPSVDELGEIVTIVAGPGGKPCGLFKADHKSANKQIPVSPAHARFTVVVLECPKTGNSMCFVPNTLVFGSITAVLGYNVVARPVASLFARFFRAPAVIYYDDFCGAVPQGLGGLALHCFKLLSGLMGFSC